MCIVTFLPVSGGALLTSNRDEHFSRGDVLAPVAYHRHGHTNYYPADKSSGGTWFIVNNLGDCGILLNGAYHNHFKKANYKASRGKLLPYIFSFCEPLIGLKSLDVVGYEPFTIILFASQQLYKCIWDGVEFQIKKLNHLVPQIWSSVTIYDLETRLAHADVFLNFLNNNKQSNKKKIVAFHEDAMLKKAGQDECLQTISITSALITTDITELSYNDLVKNTTKTELLPHKLQDVFTYRFKY